ncbi:MAG: HPr family phosphocarrier protein [Actinobacteria bacterium]|nr:HPr family phosphocarrier protein [Actinomycetota bacterium]
MVDKAEADSDKVVQDVEVPNSLGLHARPAMQLVDLANRFTAEIEISKAGQRVDAKSIMQVMTLAATQGTKLTLTARGDDAAQAVSALAGLIAEGFGEE